MPHIGIQLDCLLKIRRDNRSHQVLRMNPQFRRGNRNDGLPAMNFPSEPSSYLQFPRFSVEFSRFTTIASFQEMSISAFRKSRFRPPFCIILKSCGKWMLNKNKYIIKTDKSLWIYHAVIVFKINEGPPPSDWTTFFLLKDWRKGSWITVYCSLPIASSEINFVRSLMLQSRINPSVIVKIHFMLKTGAKLWIFLKKTWTGTWHFTCLMS